MPTTETKCETGAGFALPAVAAATAQRESRDMRSASLALAHESKRRAARILRLSLRSPSPRGAPRVAALVLISACLLAACAPTLHVDAPAMPTLEPQQADSKLDPPKIALAPLDAPPQLPDADQSPCPLGSGLAACFTLDQDVIRQQRFKILHDDRDYCRDAYERAVKRASR